MLRTQIGMIRNDILGVLDIMLFVEDHLLDGSDNAEVHGQREDENQAQPEILPLKIWKKSVFSFTSRPD